VRVDSGAASLWAGVLEGVFGGHELLRRVVWLAPVGRSQEVVVRKQSNMFIVPFLFGALTGLAWGQAQDVCPLGATRSEIVPCRTGWMTYPPRTERCGISNPHPGWFVLEVMPIQLGGTGGHVILEPMAVTRPPFDRQVTSTRLAKEIVSATAQGDIQRAREISSLLVDVLEGRKPVNGADAVTGSITLRNWGGGFCFPGATMSHCPHVNVPTITVSLVCLGQG